MIDVEIKAKCESHDFIRSTLKSKGAYFKGVDYQTDVYFKVNNGRLKLRKGNIEGALVFYERENVKGIKPSNFSLYKSKDPESLEAILRASLGIMIEVVKKREMYYIDNVKFNIDIVENLGKFIEIEAMTENPDDIEDLTKIVNNYLREFKIREEDLQSLSYSDLLLNKKNSE